MKTRILTAALCLLAAFPASAQTAGTLFLTGPSTTPGAPLLTPAAINNGVNAQLGLKADASSGILTNPTLNGTVSGTGVTSLFASPPPIGSTAPSTGAFTILTTTGNATVGGALGVAKALSLSTAPSVASTTGNIIQNLSAYPFPMANERARYWSSTLTLTGTQGATEESNFFNLILTVPGAATNPNVTATVSGGAVQSPLTIATAGSGLPNGTYTLFFYGGGGTGAAGTATISGGAVASTTLSAAGSGYTTAPGIGIEIATSSGENNIVHPYGQIDPGVNFTGGEFEPFEASFLNNGIMQGSYQGLNALFRNGTNGLVSNFAMGSHYGVVNDNPIVGSMYEYDAIYLQTWSGAGSKPTNYYMLKNTDPAASISTLGGVNIGSLAPNPVPGGLSIFGPDTSGGTCPLQVRNAANLMFTVCDAGTVTLPYGFMSLGTSGNWGKLNFGNTTSGTIQLSAPLSGALGSSTLTMPAVTDTLAVLGAAQTFTGALTFSGGITLASSTTGAATQTFTNSPCTGTTVAKWVPITITSQSGTFYVPACQ